MITKQQILNSKCGSLNLHLEVKPEKRKKAVKARNDSPEIGMIHWWLKIFCEENDLLLVPELVFCKGRKYRLDFAILRGITEENARAFGYDVENIIAAVEYQGGLFMDKSGHTNPKGATRDCEKSNIAQSMGWKYYFTYTVLNYQNVLQDLEKLLII